MLTVMHSKQRLQFVSQHVQRNVWCSQFSRKTVPVFPVFQTRGPLSANVCEIILVVLVFVTITYDAIKTLMITIMTNYLCLFRAKPNTEEDFPC